MRFEVDWHGTASNAVAEERETVADLRVFVGKRNVCEYEESARGSAGGPERADHVAVSVYPLAEEIAFGWWRLFGGRDDELRLVDGRCGYAVPDIRMTFDGAGFDAVCRPYDYGAEAGRFFQESSEQLTREKAERALADFVDLVVERLDEKRVEDCSLRSRWRRVRESRGDTGEAAFCEAAGALGIDPYDISDSDAGFIEGMGTLFTGEPLMELLSGLRGPRLVRPAFRHETPQRIREAERRPRHKSHLPALVDLRGELTNARQLGLGERPWARGYRCAREARRRLDISATSRFNVTSLAARLGAPGFAAVDSIPSGIRAVVRSGADSVQVHLRAGDHPTSRLFALGRAIGDAVANPSVKRSAVNDLRKASRQATGRAFAAEFLAPIGEIWSMCEDGRDIGTIASEFGVSEEVVERQLENEDRIVAACEG